MTYKVQVYEKGHEYTMSLAVCVCAEDRLDLERILLENGYIIKIEAVEGVEGEEDDDF